MASRARGLLDRSRVLLDRSRVAAAEFLTAPPRHTTGIPAAQPVFAEAVPAPARTNGARAEDGVLAGICSSVALRDLNLLDQLLSRLEELESGEEDHQRLSELYRLDHLATRLRRNAENLRVLAGEDTADDSASATSILDVIRAAMSSIDHYARITIGRVTTLGVVGFAAEDLGRLLAELLDNAASQSSPSSPVNVSAHLTEQGSVLIRIEDEGIGVAEDRIDELNARLGAAGALDDQAARHMGLAVVGRLAARHDVTVRLARRSPHGTVATVLLPTGVVTELADRAWSGTRTVAPGGAVNGAETNGVAGGSNGVILPGVVPVAGLPRRRVAAPARETTSAPRKPSPRPRPPVEPPEDGGVTSGGLPRRVPRSIRGAAPEPPPPAAPDPNGHDRLLADLGAFADGEQAARAEEPGGPS